MWQVWELLMLFGALCGIKIVLSQNAALEIDSVFVSGAEGKDYPTNINGTFSVPVNHHYSNKTSIIWGRNNDTQWSVLISLSKSAATYDCANTSTYFCQDAKYMYDWNKLWGKARCGYYHDHHQDSDRFVFRKCSDSSCAAYEEGKPLIQLAGYSYDDGLEPYVYPDRLLREFKTLIEPEVFYKYELIIDVNGLTTYILKTADDVELERQSIQHNETCAENFNEGTVNGLYFGGTCRAPVEIIATYRS